jgi:transposase
VLREQLAKLHKLVLDQVRGDPLCRRLMTVPGVGEAATYCSLSSGRGDDPVQLSSALWRGDQRCWVHSSW